MQDKQSEMLLILANPALGGYIAFHNANFKKDLKKEFERKYCCIVQCVVDYFHSNINEFFDSSVDLKWAYYDYFSTFVIFYSLLGMFFCKSYGVLAVGSSVTRLQRRRQSATVVAFVTE